MRWLMAEKLGRVAFSKSTGWHVEFRTVYWQGDGMPRRVRIYSVPGMGRIETEREAQKVLYRVLGEVADGRSLPDALAWYVSKKLPANLFCARWETFCADKAQVAAQGKLDKNRVVELRAYERRGYFDLWKDTTVHEIKRPGLVAWVRWMRTHKARPGGEQSPAHESAGGNSAGPLRTLSEKTIKNVLGDIGHFLRWLQREGVIHEAPEVPFDEIRLTEYAPVIPDLDTTLRILGQIGVLGRGLWLVRAFMGLRPSEARRLQVADVHEAGTALRLPGTKSKMRKGRVLEIQPPVREWFTLLEVVARFGELGKRFGAEPLFPNPNTGGFWSETAERRVIEKAMRAAGVVGIKPNEMGRHFCATQLANTPGVDFEKVRDWLGHSDTNTTRRYAKMRPQTIGRVFKAHE